MPRPHLRQSLQAGVQRDGIALLLALADNRIQGRRVADIKIGGQSLPAIEADLGSADRVTIAFDPTTGLLAYQRYGGVNGEPTTEETFTDYRPVQGLQVAYHASVRARGSTPGPAHHPHDRLQRPARRRVLQEASAQAARALQLQLSALSTASHLHVAPHVARSTSHLARDTAHVRILRCA